MNNKNKYWMGLIGIRGVLFGRSLNRILGDKFGGDGSFIMIVSVLGIIFIGISMAVLTEIFSINILITPMIHYL